MGWSDFVPQGHPTRAPGTPAPSFGQRPGASFGPGDPLTREQLAAVLWRAAGEPAADADLSAFPDGAEVSPWAADPVEWAVSTGLLRGYNHTGELAPGDPITRAQLTDFDPLQMALPDEYSDDPVKITMRRPASLDMKGERFTLDGETEVPEFAAVFLIGRKMADFGYASENAERQKMF